VRTARTEQDKEGALSREAYESVGVDAAYALHDAHVTIVKLARMGAGEQEYQLFVVHLAPARAWGQGARTSRAEGSLHRLHIAHYATFTPTGEPLATYGLRTNRLAVPMVPDVV
jgi:hypothetical protein